MKSINDYILDVPDFPKKGIIFKDITPLLQDPKGLKLAIEFFKNSILETECDVIISPESRGFIFGVPVAYQLNKSFVPIRKKGKLPRKTIEQSYDLEYGSETLEIHSDAITPGQKVVIIDDLLATGGTIKAMIKLVEALGGEVVKVCCLIELSTLCGRKTLKGYDVNTAEVY